MRCIVPLQVEQTGGMFSFVSTISLQVLHLKSYRGMPWLPRNSNFMIVTSSI